jgi:hypothetical protein
MKSATIESSKSWFYPTLWKKNMARFWPVWALYGLVWLVALPLNLMTNYRGGGNWGGLDEGANHFANYTVLEYAGELSVILSVGFAILAAMAVFSSLYQSRSVGMLHALPVKREGLFLTNYLSGLSFLLLPAVAVFGLALLAEAAKGCLNAGALGLWLGCQVCYALFFYSFAVFCAMFTGHILALPAFYAILNGLATGLYVLVSAVLRQFVFGFSGIDGVERAALWLTPVAKLIDKVGAFRSVDEARGPWSWPSGSGVRLCPGHPGRAGAGGPGPVPLPPPFAGDRRRRGGGELGATHLQVRRGPVRRPGLRLGAVRLAGLEPAPGGLDPAAVHAPVRRHGLLCGGDAAAEGLLGL